MSLLRHTRHALTLRAALVAAAVALCLLPARRAAAQYPADPVEELRQSLRYQIGDERNKYAMEHRKETLEKRVAALKTLSDLRRALGLTEWKDQLSSPENLLAIDSPARRKVGERFEAAVKAVVERGNPDDPAVVTARLALAKMIGEIGYEVRSLDPKDLHGFGRSLTPYVIRLMKDRNPDVRAAAARALGQIFPDPDVAAPAFKAMLEKDGTPQRRAAAEGLVSMIQRVAELAKSGRQQSGVQAGPGDVIDADAAILKIAGPGLADRDTRVRARTLDAVLRALQTFRDQVHEPYAASYFPPEGRKRSPAEERLIAKANDELQSDRKLYAALIAAISKQGPALARLVSDPDPRVRFEARRALEYIGEIRVRLRRLAESIPAPTGGVGLEGGAALLQVSQKGEGDPLQQALRPGLDVIARGLKDPSPRIRLATVEFLETLGDGAAEAVPALREALEDCDRFVRWAAARAFGRMEPNELVAPALGKLLGDPDVDVAKTAAATLQRFGPQAAAAVPALATAAAQGDPEVRIAAMAALGALNPEDAARAVPALVTALGHSDADVRRQAAETLGRIGPPARGAIQALRQALRDDNATVRRAASDALLSIVPPAGVAGGK